MDRCGQVWTGVDRCGLIGHTLSKQNTAHLVLTRRATTTVGERHTVGRFETSESVSLHHALEAFTDAASVSGVARRMSRLGSARLHHMGLTQKPPPRSASSISGM
jgi:hypothetical protein